MLGTMTGTRHAAVFVARMAIVLGLAMGVGAFGQEAAGQVMVSVGDQVGERGLFTARGFEAYCKILGLDASQKDAARELMDGTSAANRSASDEMRVAMKAFGEKMQAKMKDGGLEVAQKMLGEEMPAITTKYVEKRAELERQFFEDLRGLLSAEQLEKMPTVERHRRRETTLRGTGGSGGGTVDLIDVVEALKIDVTAGEIKDELARYETRLDQLLIERQRLEKDGEKRLRDSMKSMDLEGIEESQKPMKDNGQAVRDVTKVSAGKIAGLLDGTKREEFEAEVLRREFPRIYNTPHVVKELDAALGFKDLDDAQRQGLKELKEKYTREAAGLNLAWRKAIEANGDIGSVRMVIRTTDGGPEVDPEKDVNDARKARRALDEQFEEKVRGLLREEQRAKLPAKRPEKGGGWSGEDVEEEEGGNSISVRVNATERRERPVEGGKEPK